MKDSQHVSAAAFADFKYIKANNERFSTTALAVSPDS